MRPVRIGIVDDHALMRSGLERLVDGHDCWRVCWSGSSLQEFADAAPEADLLLLDIDLNGKEVSSSLVAEIVSGGVPTLVVSALTSNDAIRRLAGAGVAGFISKAESPETLMSAIESTLTGKGWFTLQMLRALTEFEPERMPPLSAQEHKVVRLYASGMKVASVARALDLSPHTVSSYLKSAREKFLLVNRPAHTQREIYRQAVELGMIEH